MGYPEVSQGARGCAPWPNPAAVLRRPGERTYLTDLCTRLESQGLRPLAEPRYRFMRAYRTDLSNGSIPVCEKTRLEITRLEITRL